jgi:hypothetical protein
MKNMVRAVLASSLFASTAAFAQDVQMNMNVHVDDDADMPSANVTIKGTDGQEGVDMQVHGGARMNVNVKGNATRTEQRREEREARQEREERREEREERRARRSEDDNQDSARGNSMSELFRNCGTVTNDPGCTMRRDGQLPMDATTFSGVIQSLKAVSNELTREEMVEKMSKRNYFTALQFGKVLDLFQNELTRLDVAKEAAPHVVNPQHALGFSSKWKNSLTADEYVEVMSGQ